MKNWFPMLFLAALLLLTVGCAKNQNKIEIPKDAAEMVVTFSWEGIAACAHDSPEIRVADIPEGSAELQVKLTDLSLPDWNHGGGSVTPDGSGIIPAGALDAGYNGPCPPPGTRHKYEFSVMAMDDQGVIIGFGRSRQKFPPKQ